MRFSRRRTLKSGQRRAKKTAVLELIDHIFAGKSPETVVCGASSSSQGPSPVVSSPGATLVAEGDDVVPGCELQGAGPINRGRRFLSQSSRTSVFS